ncbi:hypothetical protein L7F22_061143 [Adiantum nelumboides]|nr:hypothetical protein [Adiantum nelumboides]MCO5606952.1 hypothetical protein [Adiantum nelumboides]
MSIIRSHRLILLADIPSPAPAVHSTSNPGLRIDYSSSAQDASSYPSASTFHGPYMGIVLVVLLVTFFLMAAFSVYVRRYAFSPTGDIGAMGTDRCGRPRGLDRSAIEGLPIVVFHCTKRGLTEEKGESREEKEELKEEDSSTHAHEWRRRPDCVVCLTDFQEAENVRLLPKCEHCFHPECIDMWLFSHTTCPLCRRSLLPAPPPPPPPPSLSPSPPTVVG